MISSVKKTSKQKKHFVKKTTMFVLFSSNGYFLHFRIFLKIVWSINSIFLRLLCFFKLVDQTMKYAPIRYWTRPSPALTISLFLSSPVPLDPTLGSCIVNLRGYYVVLCFDRRVSAAGERGRLHKTRSWCMRGGVVGGGAPVNAGNERSAKQGNTLRLW